LKPAFLSHFVLVSKIGFYKNLLGIAACLLFAFRLGYGRKVLDSNLIET